MLVFSLPTVYDSGAMNEVEILCQVCAENHKVPVTERQRSGVDPVVLFCSNVDRRYRLTSLYLDTRRNPAIVGMPNILAGLKQELGEHNFAKKFARWNAINFPALGVIDEYPEKIEQIINAYSQGNSYPAVTSACCLVERIINRLIIKCRPHFKSHPRYKEIYRKDSFDNWDLAISVIDEWKLVSDTAVTLLKELKPYRNQSIHYNDGYDFNAVAPVVINKVIELLNEVFGVLNRRDIYLVFDIPGEVWVRSNAETLPFVKEFVLPHCYHAHAIHEVDIANKRIKEKMGKKGKLTDEEFVKLRVESQKAT